MTRLWFFDSEEKVQDEAAAEAYGAEAAGELARLNIQPLASRQGLIVTVQPPKAPLRPVSHVPCDIVLVIDVSGSMGTDAPAPSGGDDGRGETTGLSVLDLTKHAARTILETLDGSDRLGIVTFGSNAKVLQPLTPMTAGGKKGAQKNIASMQPLDCTNLWHGILEGLGLFNDQVNTGRVPAIMVLTDGNPNYMCPPQGYVPKLRKMLPLPATIHTFGFGYALRSGLLKSIAEIGGGNYSFIPDAGMIGTVFVHAVANLQSTFANNASLRITYPGDVTLRQTLGVSVDQTDAVSLGAHNQLTIPLGNIQYGQSRDIYLHYEDLPVGFAASASPPIITASLRYYQFTSQPQSIVGQRSVLDAADISEAEAAYHVSRSLICTFLSELFPLRRDEEHETRVSDPAEVQDKLASLLAAIPARNFSDERNVSLMQDLSGPEPQGQISLALSQLSFWHRWGLHYLPSLLNAHQKQICNSFKDPGPLQYGTESPLFMACRDRLDAAFDRLPAPTPSNPTSHRGVIAMSRYNSSSNPCFAGSAMVKLASGREVQVRKLRRGVKVLTPAGPRKVVAVLRTPVQGEMMCSLGDLLVTPWHPVSADGKTWSFPAHLSRCPVRYAGSIYSVLLQRDSRAEAHAINVGGLWGVSLGHGVTRESHDVRAHAFFGSYDEVVRSLRKLRVDKRGVILGGGVRRNIASGLVCGFRRPPGAAERTPEENVFQFAIGAESKAVCA